MDLRRWQLLFAQAICRFGRLPIMWIFAGNGDKVSLGIWRTQVQDRLDGKPRPWIGGLCSPIKGYGSGSIDPERLDAALGQLPDIRSQLSPPGFVIQERHRADVAVLGGGDG